MATTYQTIINMTDKQVFIDAWTNPRTFDPFSQRPLPDAYATEAESVTSALAAYTATGHTAEEIISIETRACEST